MKLVIVESPTKTKSLSKYLDNSYEIMASMGHIRDLPKSKIGISISKKSNGKSNKDIEYEFVPTYETMDKKDDQVKKLRSVANKAEEIILASDPDREGEAIAWHVREVISEKKKGKSKVDPKFKRIAFHSITKEAILEALDNPREIDMNLVNSQQARRFLDRLVGYKLSPILWKKVRRGLSAGRVQSVAVRLIVEKEREIEAHKPIEYWQIKVKVKSKKEKVKSEEFWVELAKIRNKTQGISKKEEAEKVLADLESGNYKVTDIKKKVRKTQPNAPFKTSTLQQAAANVLGWSAKRTMNVAQRLYEQGDITYHRTDSFNLAPVAIEAVRDFIGKEYGADYLPSSPRIYKTGGKVVAQEAHEAVRPTNIANSPQSYVGQEGSGDQEKLYSLIWRRTIACQMSEAVFDDTRVEVACGEYLLVANGAVVKFEGWRKLFPHPSQKLRTTSLENDNDSGLEQSLPELEVGESLEKKKVEGLQKFTQPPARFNDASLIKELEKRGIGRPSTYAAIISTILDRRYVEQKEKRFYPTNIGKAVVDFLVEHFAKEMDYEFTAKMETSLDEIASGKVDWEKMLSNFWSLFSEQIVKVDKDAVRVGVPTEATGESCPECKEGEIVIRDGKYGKFLSCSRYPECKYKAPYIEYVADVVCEKCGKRVVKKKTSKGKDFYGCEDYPNCTWAAWKLPQKKE